MADVASAYLRSLKRFWPLLGLVAAVGLALYPLWLGRFYAIGDMRDVFIPLELFFQHELRAGRLPVWHPDVGWGFPVLAAAQIGVFYPPLLLFRFWPVSIYLPLLLFTHFLALGLGMYHFLRRQPASTLAAFMGAVSFVLGAFMWQHLTHLNIILSLAWLPWQMLLAAQLAQRQVPVRTLALAPLVFGLPFLIGQLQLPLLQAGMAGLYGLLLTLGRQGMLKRVVLWAGIGAVVVALSAAQLLPTLELLPHSSRSEGSGPGERFDIVRANQYSFPLYHLPTLLFPRFFGADHTYWGKRLEVEYGIFIGTTALLAAGWSIRHHPRARWWALTALVTFLLALGSLSPFRLIGLEPSLWYFSAPARWLVVTTFALAVSTAYGIDAARAQLSPFIQYARRVRMVLVAGVLVAGVALSIVPAPARLLALIETVAPAVVSGKPPEYYQAKVEQLLTSMRHSTVSLRSPYTALPLIIVLALPALLQRRWGWRVLAAVSTVELIIIAATTTPTLPWREVLDAPATMSALPAAVRDKQARLYSVQEGGDSGAYLTNPDSRPDTTERRATHSLLPPMRHAQYGLPGVEWSASLDFPEHEHLLNSLRGVDEEKNKFINRERAQNVNIGALLAPVNFTGPLLDAPRTIVDGVIIIPLDPAPRAGVYNEAGELLSTAAYHEDTPTIVQITYTSPEPGTLIVRDSWYPAWQATLDGTPVAITATPELFRAITVPAGTHEVQLTYRSPATRRGLAISAATAAVCLFGFVAGRGRTYHSG